MYLSPRGLPHCPPPPRRDPCPCPVTLRDFLNRFVEVTTRCGEVSGRLVFVGENSIVLQESRSGQHIVVRCGEICFVRIPKFGPQEEQP